MNDQTIKAIVAEIAPALVGRQMGKIFQLSRVSLAIDFRTTDNRYLYLSVEPAPSPRLYLIARRVRELEKRAIQPTAFTQVLHKHLAGARLLSLTKDVDDRIVRFAFTAEDVTGAERAYTLVAQLTGRASNLLLLNGRGHVIDALRTPRGEGQEIGDTYAPPPAPPHSAPPGAPEFAKGSFADLSEAADDFYLRLEAERAFAAKAAAARTRLKKEVAQRLKLRRRLEADRAAHGDAAEHKRIGDLLLANLTTAKRRGGTVTVLDYYADDAPPLELEIDENLTLQEEAARRFARYTKAKRAAEEIAQRLATIELELTALRSEQDELEEIISAGDSEALETVFGAEKKSKAPARGKRQAAGAVPGARRYLSSDGYEILVGRGARDNDHLTFRVARPHDLWLHAADYPGSHVVVINPTRKELPHRTIIEAAQLAANFSHARKDAKVNVHYTPRKFLSKPKGAAPGLVRMSSFRTLTVEPRESVERI